MQDLRQFIIESMRDWGVPGVAIAVVREGETVFAEGFGVRDAEHDLPVTADTPFGISSCTKPFTTMAMGMLVDEGKELAAHTKRGYLGTVRRFLADCQEWGWIRRRFDPYRALATPRSIRALIGPDPRVIADDVWAKLLWAGLNLQPEDLDQVPDGGRKRSRYPWYPIEMVRALAMVWLFAGLRADEIRRLRVGCVRWQREDVAIPGTGEELPKDAVCLLDVPTNKTGTAFTKPVDRVVGEAIAAWERVRPDPPREVDAKTGEVVSFLFSYRGLRLGDGYINASLVPTLCRKVGIPPGDGRGGITSHRARSTMPPSCST